MPFNLPDIPKKAAPHIMAHIQPKKKNQTVPICSKPTQKLMHMQATFSPADAPLLAQHHTEKPASIVPAININM